MLCYLSSREQIDTILANQPVVAVYKFNSNGCRISQQTIQNLLEGIIQHDLKHVYLIDIIAHKELSDYITLKSDVQHESPQMIVFHQGEVKAHTSHMHITTDFLLNHF